MVLALEKRQLRFWWLFVFKERRNKVMPRSARRGPDDCGSKEKLLSNERKSRKKEEIQTNLEILSHLS